MPKKVNTPNDTLMVGILLLLLIPTISVVRPLLRILLCPNSASSMCELGFDIGFYSIVLYGSFIYIPLTLILLITGILKQSKKK